MELRRCPGETLFSDNTNKCQAAPSGGWRKGEGSGRGDDLALHEGELTAYLLMMEIIMLRGNV